MADEPKRIRVLLATAAAVRQEWIQHLDPGERERHRAILRPKDRNLFLLGSCLVRAAVSEATNVALDAVAIDRTCDRCSRPHGKTRVPGTGVELSVSHSGGLVAVAVSNAGPVGVDIEQIDASWDPLLLSNVALAPGERDYLLSLPANDQAAGFCTYWTRKEAVLKTTGDGLRYALPDLVVAAPDQPAQVINWQGRPRHGVRIADLELAAGYRGSLGFQASDPVAITVEPAQAVLDRIYAAGRPEPEGTCRTRPADRRAKDPAASAL